MDVIRLLKSKNRCLARFRNLSQEFLTETAGAQGFANLERFHRTRDRIIRALDLFDRKIAETIAMIPTLSERTAMADEIRPILQERETIVREILAIDEQIILGIEREKQKIAGELARSRKGSEVLGKYKSGITDAGEGIDTKL